MEHQRVEAQEDADHRETSDARLPADPGHHRDCTEDAWEDREEEVSELRPCEPCVQVEEPEDPEDKDEDTLRQDRD